MGKQNQKFIVNDEATWPDEVVACLERHKDILLAWEQNHIGQQPHITPHAGVYDVAIEDIFQVLSNFALRGYHCTRLTNEEIDHIVKNGMALQNGSSLRKRIDVLTANGLLSPDIAELLKSRNQADEKYRTGRLWFCFFPPYKAGHRGIERFFRSWGGEALYNSHERDPITGPILARIGTPCIIEADVQVGRGHNYLEDRLARIFLINRGFKTPESTNHEGYSKMHIPAESIHRVVRFPEPDFFALTKADTWRNPLS